MLDQLVERYIEIPPSQRYLLVGVIIGALIGLHYYFIYDGQQSEIRALLQTYNKKQSTKNEKENVAQNRTTYQNKLGELQEQLDQARAQLPDEADVPQLLAQLGAKARETGRAIDEFKPSEETIKDFYAEIGFKMKARGSYHELGLFIDSVGKLDRIINISNLVMESPKIESSKVVVSANFDVKTYRFVSEAEAAAHAKTKAKGKR